MTSFIKLDHYFEAKIDGLLAQDSGSFKLPQIYSNEYMKDHIFQLWRKKINY